MGRARGGDIRHTCGYDGRRGGGYRMFGTTSVSFWIAVVIVVLGIPVALLEVYYFRIRKRRQQGR